VPGSRENSGTDTDKNVCATLHLVTQPLSRFRGVRRRQETLVSAPALTVIEDFAHHPTALAETLKSIRNRFPGATLTAIFEPRSNTARTRALQDDFTAALAQADEVYLGPVNRAEKLPPAERLDTEAIARALSAQNIRAESFPTNAALLEKLLADTLPPAPFRPRVVIFFSNGHFDGITAKYATLAAR
jgi:UDP-N-acetylmuramate: L-alanyl-gamma-D-glutamyl-meso-diaminopimelate ligase